MTEMVPSETVYGVMAEFENPGQLIEACKKARDKGYRQMDAYSPYPVEELHEVLHLHDRRVSLSVLIAGLCGAMGGYEPPGPGV